jgi:hypothetical protein
LEDHQWNEPQRLDCSSAIRKCSRCKETDTIRLAFSDRQHRFGPLQKDVTGRRGRRCQDCLVWEDEE